MAVNNVYYVDMEKRYLDYQNGTVDMEGIRDYRVGDVQGHPGLIGEPGKPGVPGEPGIKEGPNGIS